MNLKTFNLLFLLFISSLLLSQATIAQLPYNKMPKYPRKSTTGIVMAKMVDELGYKYYWATEGLLNNEQGKTFNSDNLPRLFLKGVYQMSESIVNCTSEDKMKLEFEEFSFNDYRKNTLLNLNGASNKLIENGETSLFLNWELFTKSIAVSDAYCDQIIEFREKNGNPSKLENDFVAKKLSDSELFEQSIGADGLTNGQWMKITERGGGPDAFDKIAKTRKANQKIIFEHGKEKRAIVTVGDLETMENSSNIVDGLVYTYFYDPPDQISVLFSNDKEYIEGIINWIIYINSGNPVKLSEMFRVGLDIVINLDTSEGQKLVRDRYRDTTDKEENKVRLEFSEQCFEKTEFSDILIQEVRIIDSDQIVFFGESNPTDNFYQTPLQKILILKNIEGNLLERIKVNINQMREGLYEYDDNLMNLRNY